jgi:hypothetical protein
VTERYGIYPQKDQILYLGGDVDIVDKFVRRSWRGTHKRVNRSLSQR